LAETRKFKSAAAFAREYGLDVTYIRQILNLNRELGEKSARSIESAMQKPFGYLDAPEENSEIQAVYAMLKALPHQHIGEIRRHCAAIAEEYNVQLPSEASFEPPQEEPDSSSE